MDTVLHIQKLVAKMKLTDGEQKSVETGDKEVEGSGARVGPMEDGIETSEWSSSLESREGRCMSNWQSKPPAAACN